MYSLQFQAMCNLQFHNLNIPPQQQPMLRRLFLRRHLYQCSRYRRLLLDFLLHEKTGQLWKNRRIGDNFGIAASKKLGAEGNWCTKKSLWTLLMKTKRMPAENSGRAMQPVCRDEKVFPSLSWMCGPSDSNRHSGGSGSAGHRQISGDVLERPQRQTQHLVG